MQHLNAAPAPLRLPHYIKKEKEIQMSRIIDFSFQPAPAPGGHLVETLKRSGYASEELKTLGKNGTT